jgi:chromosome segregation ATPase
MLYSRRSRISAKKPGRTSQESQLETEQSDKRFTWLDEQRRRDAEEIGRVAERLEGHEQELRRLADQIQILAGDQSRTAALATKASQMDESIGQHRLEINVLIETVEQRRIARERQLEELRKAGESQTAEAIDAVRVELKATKDLRDSMDARRQEELRISRTLDGLSKRIESLGREFEERNRQTASLQEGRRQDAQRISELESRAVEQHKKHESLVVHLQVAEDQARRLQTKLGELDASENELRQAQMLWTEAQAVRQAEFERGWKAHEKRFNSFAGQAEGLDERLAAFEETHRSLKRLESELSDVVARLERRIEEVSEIQRLSEDRFKQEWSGQQADEHKRWSAFKLEAEEQRRDHERLHQKLSDDLRSAQDDIGEALESLEQLSHSGQQRLQETLTMLREWAAEATGKESQP